ncbi:hypothetical protein EON64_05565 [archaeon]|nr:MAG: hypothetical protein EON64_05565 [archaeon]
MEFISSLAMLSGMTSEEKTRFIFAMYDFGESASLTLDEMVLAYRSSLSGACKLCRIEPPTEQEIEDTIAIVFDQLKELHNRSANPTDDVLQIDRELFVSFTLTTPDVFAWLEYFDDLAEYQLVQSTYMVPLDYLPEEHSREANDEAYMYPTIGGMQRLLIESDTTQRGRKPWQNVLPIINPAQGASRGESRPLKNMEMEWVYGYNAFNSRHNVAYTAAGEALYPAGALCVIQNIAKNTQRYFNAHHDVITAITLFTTDDAAHVSSSQVAATYAASNASTNLTIVATGERGFRPSIFVWDANTCSLLATMAGFHRGGIARLDFSPNRQRLVALGMDPYHSIAVYAWRSAERLWASRTTALVVHDVRFLSNDLIANCGEDHIFFWKQDYSSTSSASNSSTNSSAVSTARERFLRYRGQAMQAQSSVVTTTSSTAPNAVKGETLWCVGVVGKQTVFTTTEQGHVQVWEGRNMVRTIKAHTGAIQTYYPTEAGMVTACTMGKALIWSEALEIVATFSLSSLGPVRPVVSAVCYDSLANKMLVGFESAEIFEMDATDGRNMHTKGAIVSAHSHHRVCGLSCHPLQSNIFCTVGDDKSVRLFDCVERVQIKMCTMDSKAHCVDFSRDGRILLVGLGSGVQGEEEKKEGGHVLINAEDLTILHEARDCNSVISDCKFSPDGEKYALSSHDGNIYLYKTKNFSSYAMCRGHEDKVTHVDFSSTSGHLMSNSAQGELLFWDAAIGQQLPPKQMKGVKWDSNSCTFTRDTQSFHMNSRTNFGNNLQIQFVAACKAHSEDVVFIVDNYGTILASQFPCFYEGNPIFSIYSAHGKGVSNVKISCDDSRLFTVGLGDGSIIQWRLSETEPTIPESELKRIENTQPLLLCEVGWEGKALDLMQIQVRGILIAVYEFNRFLQMPDAADDF